MKKVSSHLFLFITCLFLFAFQCDEENITLSEEELKELADLKTEIETLASSSICNESTECKYIAFGSKPCGGPWSYLIYSTSINTNVLENKVEQYNQLETVYNAKWGVVSDCALAQEPSDVICEDNKCVAVF
ncbi:hypothetical protein [Seonamhaeicola aphaedonensis]|uniref:Lipoprotein n=1 Tax=Seonamhaeicola aphaedonensis TaxID=1461338 RepID=A0A3D9HHX0_9FLAO|nr:hypothetical protein [Seonamhaeicola aphaedonensis]RED48851.1 hypothetical protein DFQ02_103182 [Seonamhaeicola aphaedonensis]